MGVKPVSDSTDTDTDTDTDTGGAVDTGDGIDTVGYYVRSTGTWHLLSANDNSATDTSFDYGGSQNYVLSGDWDGD